MAVSYIAKNWKDYPDTSTPITAAELNRIEQGINSAVEDLQMQDQAIEEIENNLQTQGQAISLMGKTITDFILNSIIALHPEYTMALLSETVDESTPTLVFDLGVYNPDKSDGLILTVDGVMISPLAYGITVENNAAVVRVFESAGVKVGQTLKMYIYHKPQNSGGTAAGPFISLPGGAVVQTIFGIAESITDTEE